jgi:hypothetical protein
MTMNASVADLNTTGIDIEVAGPEDYVDGGPDLLPEGTYDLLLKEYEIGKDREDPTKFKGYVRIRRAVVTGGDQDGRYVNNLTIWATTYLRKGVKVSGLGDFCRGIDDTANPTADGLDGVANLLDRAIDQMLPVRVKLTWQAWDRTGWEQQGGAMLTKGTPEYKELRKRCTVKGMRNFPMLPDGSHRTSIAGPISNETLEAELTIDSVTPSGKRR